MIEEIEVIKTKKDRDRILYICKLKLNSKIVYSYFYVDQNNQFIMLAERCYSDPSCESMSIWLPKGSKKQMEIFILNRKEIRLRHLLNPYEIK